MPSILAWGDRGSGIFEFETNLVYIVSSKIARTT